MQFKPPRPQPSNLMLRTVWDYFAKFFKAPEFGSPVISTYLGGPTAVSTTVFSGSNVNFQLPSSGYTPTTTMALVTGCTKTFTMPAAGNVLVSAGMDISGSVAGFGRMLGQIFVDTVGITPQLIYDSNGGLYRLTVNNVWVIGLTAGSHTIELRAQRQAAAGTVVLNATHTNIAILGP